MLNKTGPSTSSSQSVPTIPTHLSIPCTFTKIPPTLVNRVQKDRDNPEGTIRISRVPNNRPPGIEDHVPAGFFGTAPIPRLPRRPKR